MKMQAFVIPMVFLGLTAQASARLGDMVVEACPDLAGVYQITDQVRFVERTRVLTISQSLENNQTRYQMVYEEANELPETISLITNGRATPVSNGQYLLTASCREGALIVVEEYQKDGKTVQRVDNRFTKVRAGGLLQQSITPTATEESLWTNFQ